MTTGQIIDGKAHALRLRAEIAQQVITRAASGARAPCLAVVLVGEDPASQVYVKNKIAACRDAGITSIEAARQRMQTRPQGFSPKPQTPKTQQNNLTDEQLQHLLVDLDQDIE